MSLANPLLRSLALPAAATTLLASCSAGNLPNYADLGGLRVLAIVAEPPEAAPGQTVTLTPLVSDLGGAGRALLYDAEACSDPGIAYGAVADCSGQADRVSIASGAAVTGLAADEHTAAAPALTPAVPSDFLASASATQRKNGVPWIVTYRVYSSDSIEVRAFKRVIVSERDTKNKNPSIGGVQADGVALAGSLPSSRISLKPVFADGSAETYSGLDSTAKTESLITTWFLSDGSMERARTLGEYENSWTPPAKAPEGRGVVLVLVTRDGRGGESVLSATLKATQP